MGKSEKTHSPLLCSSLPSHASLHLVATSPAFVTLFFVRQLFSIAELIKIQLVIVAIVAIEATVTKPIVVLLFAPSPCTILACPLFL
jgi:hypothetical protein